MASEAGSIKGVMAGVLANQGTFLREDRRETRAAARPQGESPQEGILRRAEEALRAEDLDACRRLLAELEAISPQLPAIAELRVHLRAAEERGSKQQENLKKTEDMLLGYIQQRKKTLAQFALNTLVELAPRHPRRQEYEVWVKELDLEVALDQRIQKGLAAGRAALQAEHFEEAAAHLETLRKLAPQAPALQELEDDLAFAQRSRAESADIARLKQRLEGLLGHGDFAAAERVIEQLNRLDVPKISLDFLRQRLMARRTELQQEAERASLDAQFKKRLAARDWMGARDVAEAYSECFPDSPRTTEMFGQINALEAADRREQSKRQGLAACERFIAAGQRREAELALQVLRNLVEPEVLAVLDERIKQL